MIAGKIWPDRFLTVHVSSACAWGVQGLGLEFRDPFQVLCWARVLGCRFGELTVMEKWNPTLVSPYDFRVLYPFNAMHMLFCFSLDSFITAACQRMGWKNWRVFMYLDDVSRLNAGPVPVLRDVNRTSFISCERTLKKQLWGNCFPVRNTIWLQLFNSSLSTFHTLPHINTCFGNIHTWITCQSVLSWIHGLYHQGMNSLQCLGRTSKNIPLAAWFTSSTA